MSASPERVEPLVELDPDFRTTPSHPTGTTLKGSAGLIWDAIRRNSDGNTKEAADIWREDKGQGRH